LVPTERFEWEMQRKLKCAGKRFRL
jgi:hypothetical protein